jgi:hypothetical protein
MNRPDWTRLARCYAWAIGGLDGVSGVGLMLLPDLTLRLMLITPPFAPEAAGYVRFVGALVMGVGGMYLLAAARPDAGRLKAVLLLTLPIRGAVAVFTLGAAVAGWLPIGWLVVTAADLLLVGTQMLMLSKGAGRDD